MFSSRSVHAQAVLMLLLANFFWGLSFPLIKAIMFAQTYYAVHDIQSTCATLTGFMSTVSAQNGKKINKLTAAQLLATAQAIEVALNCQ